MTSSGKLFQTLAPAIGKARLPTVGSRKDGTSSWLDDADHSLRWLGMSATGENRDVMLQFNTELQMIFYDLSHLMHGTEIYANSHMKHIIKLTN